MAEWFNTFYICIFDIFTNAFWQRPGLLAQTTCHCGTLMVIIYNCLAPKKSLGKLIMEKGITATCLNILFSYSNKMYIIKRYSDHLSNWIFFYTRNNQSPGMIQLVEALELYAEGSRCESEFGLPVSTPGMVAHVT